jgi:hypothetical protein
VGWIYRQKRPQYQNNTLQINGFSQKTGKLVDFGDPFSFRFDDQLHICTPLTKSETAAFSKLLNLMYHISCHPQPWKNVNADSASLRATESTAPLLSNSRASGPLSCTATYTSAS